VTWRIDETVGQPRVIFEWRERGGPPVEPPQRRGFGTELLEQTLAFELKGKTTLAFDRSGLQCMITIPLNRRIVHTPALDG
jgi:two-component system, chemotaxis family, CheB/CheR fusion protein